MSINGNEIETAIQNERITELDRRIDDLWYIVSKQNERIEKLERQVMLLKAATDHDAVAIGAQRQRIEELETCATLNAETIVHVAGLRQYTAELRRTVARQDERIEELEAGLPCLPKHRQADLRQALVDAVRCLIDGRVSVAGVIPGELHGHRILGTESVQAMVEVYHRLEK